MQKYERILRFAIDYGPESVYSSHSEFISLTFDWGCAGNLILSFSRNRNSGRNQNFCAPSKIHGQKLN